MKHRAGKKIYPRAPGLPLTSECLSALALQQAMKGTRWGLAQASATNRKLLIGSGNLAKELPKKKLGWAAEAMQPKGKPLTKAAKRKLKAAKQRNKI